MLRQQKEGTRITNDYFTHQIYIIKKTFLSYKALESGSIMSRKSSPKGHVACVFAGRAFGVLQLDELGGHGVVDDAGGGAVRLISDIEPGTQGLVAHLLVHDVLQAAVLVSGLNALGAVHLVKGAGREQNNFGVAVERLYHQRGQLV